MTSHGDGHGDRGLLTRAVQQVAAEAVAALLAGDSDGLAAHMASDVVAFGPGARDAFTDRTTLCAAARRFEVPPLRPAQIRVGLADSGASA
jgi:ketosteroid isomerase-like protein